MTAFNIGDTVQHKYNTRIRGVFVARNRKEQDDYGYVTLLVDNKYYVPFVDYKLHLVFDLA